MPTYQYACTACDHTFEQFQSFSDDALTVCPECAGRLRKVFNAVGVVFKGSGFYRNDSRSSSSSSGSESKSGSSSESKSESAPGSKSESKSESTSSTGSDSKPAATSSASSSATSKASSD